MKFCVITCTVRTVVLVVNLRQVIQNLKMRFSAETACKIPDVCDEQDSSQLYVILSIWIYGRQLSRCGSASRCGEGGRRSI